MPTKRGYVLLVSCVVLYLFARAGSIGELYALAATALVFPVIAIVFVRVGRHSLRFDRTVGPRRLFAGNDVQISVTVRNQSARSSPPLVLEDDAPAAFAGPIRFSIPSVSGRKQTTILAKRKVVTRGRYGVGPLRARLIDPFGLAAIDRVVGDRATLVVYPRVEIIGEYAPPQRNTGGERSAIHLIAPSGDDFYGVREWRDGDDLRKIHWRSTARRDELMIRQDEVRPFPRATILIDNRVEEHRDADPASRLEYSVSAAASIVWELAKQGYALRVATADAGPNGARWGREAVDPLLAALAVVERSSKRSLLPLVKRAGGHSAGGALFAIVPPPSKDMLIPLARLRSSYHWCGAVLLDAASFHGGAVPARARAIADQRIAECDRILERAGWRVVVAGSSDRFKGVWQALVGTGASRPNYPSLRS